MGYYVNTMQSNFIVKAENLPDLYKRLCEMNAYDELKTGGTYGPEGAKAKWFAWTDPNYPEICEDAISIFEHFGFEVMTDHEGNIVSLHYDDKAGNENILLAFAARYVEDDSYIDWRGEDGLLFRYLFRDGRMHEVEGRVTFDNEPVEFHASVYSEHGWTEHTIPV